MKKTSGRAKSVFIILSVFILAFLSVAGVTAEVKKDTVYLEVAFPEPKITISDYSSEYSHIEMDGLRSLGEVGEPVLPIKGLKVLIPDETKIKNIDITLGEKVTLPGIYMIEPGQKEYPLSQIGKIEIKPDAPKAEVYQKDAAYPGKIQKFISQQKKMGYPIAILDLYPVEYNPKKGELSYYKGMTIAVRIEDDIEGVDKEQLKAKPHLRGIPDVQKHDQECVLRLIDNKNDLKDRGKKSDTLTQESIMALSLGPINTSLRYNFVIITSSTFAASFEPLKQYRISKGVTTNIITVEWIYANYPGNRPDGGSDNQTKIRNFIIDAYNNWGTKYVLLAGDGDSADKGGESGNNIIPARLMYDPKEDEYVPADFYYGCLDGTFDGDRDGLYGENNDGVSGGDVDFVAEVYVGRAAVDSVTEVNNFVRKTLAYEGSADTYLTNSYLLGERLGQGGLSEYATENMEQIRWGSSAHGYTTMGFLTNSYRAMDADTLYDSSDKTWSKTDLVNIINNGVNLLNHLGHANLVTDLKLTNADADSLTNSKYFIAYSQGCFAGAFDDMDTTVFTNFPSSNDCFAEHLTLGYGGAAAFVANSRFGVGKLYSSDSSSQYYARQFWDALFSEGITTLSRMNQDSKEDNLPYLGYGSNRYVYFELTLFGDPTLAVKLPGTLVLSPSYNLIEKVGDWDGRIEPGEEYELQVSLKAFNQYAYNVYGVLSCTEPNTITQGNSAYGNIGIGGIVYNAASPFRFIVPAPNADLKLTMTANGYSKVKTVPIEIKGDSFHRFRNRNTEDCFYTASETEKNKLISQYSNIYTYEGIGCGVFKGRRSGTVPLYRFYNKTNGAHFYTADEVEKHRLFWNYYNTWQYESIACYVYPTYAPAKYSVPLYRFYNKQRNCHLFTVSEAEKTKLDVNSSIYTNEGIACYVFPAGDVFWTDLAGVHVAGTTLTKTAATGWGNSGAASRQSFSANGGVEFMAYETDTYRMIGLSYRNTDSNYVTIDYGIDLGADGYIYVYEKGVYKGKFIRYTKEDKLSVERVGTTVYYKKNGATFYTSATSSSGTMIVDAALYTSGATIVDAKILY
jgi:hypothetical protein